MVAFLTSHTYAQVSQGLFHMDRLLLAFYIATAILRQDGPGRISNAGICPDLLVASRVPAVLGILLIQCSADAHHDPLFVS